MCESRWKIQTLSKRIKDKTKNESLLPSPMKSKADFLTETLCASVCARKS